MIKYSDTNNGPMLYLANDAYVGRSIELYGEFSRGEQDFFKFASRGNTAIDIGANLGAHSLAMAKYYKNVYCFEAQEFIFRLLSANVALCNNVRCFNAAVGSEDGSVPFPDVDYDKLNNFGAMGRYAMEGIETPAHMVDTPLVTLDNVKPLQDVDQIDLIKIDVEGMEREVLLGAKETIAKHRPILYVENDRPNRSKDLVETIYRLGYTACWHVTHLFNWPNFKKNNDNVFANIASFNLICIPEGHWLKVNNALPCTPDNPGMPNGA